MQLECMTCGWIGEEDELECPGNDEPGCPKCFNTDFLDVEE